MKTVHRNVLDDEYIAEAQRLTIAQNCMLRFMYDTWWTWWLPRIAFLGGIAFLVHIGDTRNAVILGLFLLLPVMLAVDGSGTATSLVYLPRRDPAGTASSANDVQADNP